MYKYIFDYSGVPISLFSEKKIKKEISDSIYNIIEFLAFEFNHLAYNSGSYGFNQANEGLLTNASKEFIYFLKLNLSYASKYKNFSPFESSIRINNVSNVVYIDESANSFSKNVPLKLNSSILRAPIILDTVFDLLKMNSVENFLINYKDHNIASGNKTWNVEYELDNATYSLKVISGSVCFETGEENEKSQISKFISQDKPINHKYLIIKGAKSAAENTAIKAQTKDLYMHSHYANFAKGNKIGLVVWDKDDNLYDFE